MAGSSNFKIFDENLVNIMDDTAYLASTYRTQGAVSGVAPSNVHNKLYRQTSVMAAAIAEVAKNRGEVVSDADFNNLVAALTTAFGIELIDKNIWKASTTYAVGDIVDAPTLSNWAYAECSVAGTSDTIEPTWGTTVGATITDNTVTWLLKRKGNNIPYNQQVYDTAGTYSFTAPKSGLYKVTVTAAGGGAGGVRSTTTNISTASGGGGAGGTAIKKIYIESGTSITVTVGAGGNGGTTTPTNGQSGGASSFGTYCSASGGTGSLARSVTSVPDIGVGGAGGIGNDGDINIRGGAGGNGTVEGSSCIGGVGGCSIFLGCAPGGGSVANSGINGAGGSGVASTASNAYSGGAGGDGLIIIEY